MNSQIQGTIDRLVADGTEVGVQVAVVADGRFVVDAVGGSADPELGAPVLPETLFFAASTAKGIASAVVHVLVERGLLTYDLRLVDVWPEFAPHGKESVTLEHVLTHSAGLPAPPYRTTVEDLCDWDGMCRALAAAEPWWPPGSRFGYHALTFGYLVGETVRRATDRTLSTWLRELVSGPLGVADGVHFGVPAALLPRVARQLPPVTPQPGPPEPGTPEDRALPPGVRLDADMVNRHDLLTADIPSIGTMNARSAALVYAALMGQLPDHVLVSPDRLTEMTAVRIEGPDQVMGVDSAWSFGFSPNRPGDVVTRAGSTFGMLGMNGSAAWADVDSGVAVAVMRNRFDPLGLTLLHEVDQVVADAFPPRR